MAQDDQNRAQRRQLESQIVAACRASGLPWVDVVAVLSEALDDARATYENELEHAEVAAEAE